jgi:hypothetical protein
MFLLRLLPLKKANLSPVSWITVKGWTFTSDSGGKSFVEAGVLFSNIEPLLYYCYCA